MTDVVTLQLPRERDFFGVAHLVLGGLGARLDLTYDVLEDMTTAIDELPLDSRTALILHDVEGLSNVEVAESLGITVASAKSRTRRARLFLRKRLGRVMSGATVGAAAPSPK